MTLEESSVFQKRYSHILCAGVLGGGRTSRWTIQAQLWLLCLFGQTSSESCSHIVSLCLAMDTSWTFDSTWTLQGLRMPHRYPFYWDAEMTSWKMQRVTESYKPVANILEVGPRFACRHPEGSYVSFITRLISPLSPWTAQ